MKFLNDVKLPRDPLVNIDAATKKYVDDKVVEHGSLTMPHIMTNHKTGKTYRFGRQVSADGVPQIISEEVII